MRSENQTEHSQPVIENELDVRELCRALWAGKLWIIGCMLLFMAGALVFSFLVKQEWSSTAITDKPSINQLGQYYTQKQFLQKLDGESSVTQGANGTPVTSQSEVYAEFILQLSSYDTRREFWLQSDYYKDRLQGNVKSDAVLLDELINAIQYTPRDEKKMVNDSVKLTLETAEDAAQLLRQYVAFASYRTIKNLNQELQGTWQVRQELQQRMLVQQKGIAQANYDREMSALERGLSIAQHEQGAQVVMSMPRESLADSELFLLGAPVLKARIEALKANGLILDSDYVRNQEILTLLQAGPVLDEKFQVYRYLRTPEQPIKRDSPRRAFLMGLWGSIGIFLGAGLALVLRGRRL